MNRLHSNSLLSLLLLCYAALFMLSVAMVKRNIRTPLMLVFYSGVTSDWTHEELTELTQSTQSSRLEFVCWYGRIRGVFANLLQSSSEVSHISWSFAGRPQSSCQIRLALLFQFTVLLVNFLIVMASMIQRWYLLPLDLITVALSHYGFLSPSLVVWYSWL